MNDVLLCRHCKEKLQYCFCPFLMAANLDGGVKTILGRGKKRKCAVFYSQQKSASDENALTLKEVEPLTVPQTM